MFFIFRAKFECPRAFQTRCRLFFPTAEIQTSKVVRSFLRRENRAEKCAYGERKVAGKRGGRLGEPKSQHTSSPVVRSTSLPYVRALARTYVPSSPSGGSSLRTRLDAPSSGSLRSMRGTGTGRHGNGARHAQRTNDPPRSCVSACSGNPLAVPPPALLAPFANTRARQHPSVCAGTRERAYARDARVRYSTRLPVCVRIQIEVFLEMHSSLARDPTMDSRTVICKLKILRNIKLFFLAIGRRQGGLSHFTL